MNDFSPNDICRESCSGWIISTRVRVSTQFIGTSSRHCLALLNGSSIGLLTNCHVRASRARQEPFCAEVASGAREPAQRERGAP